MADTVDGLGLQRGTVRLVEADVSWADAYRREVERCSAFVAHAQLPPLVFEHIGSTAVPGLVAKPIIDFMGGYREDADPLIYFETLRASGYEHRGSQGVPHRELFVLGPTSLRTHHLNLVRAGDAFWRDHLVFRDRLRNDPRLAAAYGELKRKLAGLHPTDRGQYTAAKTAFVHEVLAGGLHPPGQLTNRAGHAGLDS